MEKVYTKNALKELIAEGHLDLVFDNLLDSLSIYLKDKNNKKVEKIYDAIILNSGKYKGIIHEEILGIVDSKEASVRKSQVVSALLLLINHLSEDVISFKNNNKNESAYYPSIREQIAGKENYHYLYDIFLSFSSKDLAESQQFCEELRGNGLRVFMSSEVMKANIGNSFFEKIDYALQNSQHFVLLCTPNAMRSEWVKTEYETFYNEYFIKNKANRKFLLLKGRYYDISVVPTLFKRLQFAETTQQILTVFLENDTNTNADIGANKSKTVFSIKYVTIGLICIFTLMFFHVYGTLKYNSALNPTQLTLSNTLTQLPNENKKLIVSPDEARERLRMDQNPTVQLVQMALSDFSFKHSTKPSAEEAIQMLQWLGVEPNTIKNVKFSKHTEVWGKLPTKLEICIWVNTYNMECYGIRFQRSDLIQYSQSNDTYIEICNN
jgi:hypothetical protein